MITLDMKSGEIEIIEPETVKNVSLRENSDTVYPEQLRLAECETSTSENEFIKVIADLCCEDLERTE